MCLFSGFEGYSIAVRALSEDRVVNIRTILIIVIALSIGLAIGFSAFEIKDLSENKTKTLTTKEDR